MKRLLFLVVAVLLMATASLRAQKVYDPDGPWWNYADSLVMIPLAINSSADDYFPVVVDKLLMYNSDRNKDGDEAVLSQNQNIYRTTDSTWTDSEKGYFFNDDNQTSVIGTNGTVIYLYKPYNNGDVYVSYKDEKGKWTNPKLMKSPVNSPGNEQSIAFGGGFLFVSSDRDGGLGEHDIYWMRISFEGNFGKLQVFPFNSPADEVDVTLSPDGKTMYFSSNTDGKGDAYLSLGDTHDYDVYASSYVNGTWQEPIRLPYPINSSYDDRGFHDYDTMYLMDSDRGGNFDIYQGYTYPQKTSISKYLALTAADSAKKMATDTTFEIHRNRVSLATDSSKKMAQDTTFTVYKDKDRFERIEEHMDSSGITEYYAMVQIGAYYNFTVQKFRSFYPSLKNTPITIKDEPNGKGGMIQKFLVDKQFTTIKDAEACQREMVDTHRIKDAFVAIYNLKHERIAIFNTYDGKFILLSGDREPTIF